MLQAFALKTYLQQSGIKTDLVRYEPPFMTGRNWWFPYVPIEGRKKRLEWEKKAWKSHLRMGMAFFFLLAYLAALFLLCVGKRPDMESGYYLWIEEGILWSFR